MPKDSEQTLDFDTGDSGEADDDVVDLLEVVKPGRSLSSAEQDDADFTDDLESMLDDLSRAENASGQTGVTKFPDPTPVNYHVDHNESLDLPDMDDLDNILQSLGADDRLAVRKKSRPAEDAQDLNPLPDLPDLDAVPFAAEDTDDLTLALGAPDGHGGDAAFPPGEDTPEEDMAEGAIELDTDGLGDILAVAPQPAGAPDDVEKGPGAAETPVPSVPNSEEAPAPFAEAQLFPESPDTSAHEMLPETEEQLAGEEAPPPERASVPDAIPNTVQDTAPDVTLDTIPSTIPDAVRDTPGNAGPDDAAPATEAAPDAGADAEISLVADTPAVAETAIPLAPEAPAAPEASEALSTSEIPPAVKVPSAPATSPAPAAEAGPDAEAVSNASADAEISLTVEAPAVSETAIPSAPEAPAAPEASEALAASEISPAVEAPSAPAISPVPAAEAVPDAPASPEPAGPVGQKEAADTEPELPPDVLDALSDVYPENEKDAEDTAGNGPTVPLDDMDMVELDALLDDMLSSAPASGPGPAESAPRHAESAPAPGSVENTSAQTETAPVCGPSIGYEEAANLSAIPGLINEVSLLRGELEKLRNPASARTEAGDLERVGKRLDSHSAGLASLASRLEDLELARMASENRDKFLNSGSEGTEARLTALEEKVRQMEDALASLHADLDKMAAAAAARVIREEIAALVAEKH
ncbi:MAG: hypothetical protein LBQ51_01880 [Desulfovibrio sp.]|jgi:hypothetical protein|nr:hypothetical protein [Desulfovibrio sp.]